MAEIVGEKALFKELQRLADKSAGALGLAIYQEAVLIFNVSQEEVAVDKGDLRRSGLVSVGRGAGHKGDPEIFISYGIGYALPVHEKHPTKSKFLQGPFERAIAGLEGRIADRTKKNLKQGRGMGGVRDLKGT